mgnify:CR=1 FL=1
MEGHKLDPEAKNDISVKGARATAFSEDNVLTDPTLEKLPMYWMVTRVRHG